MGSDYWTSKKSEVGDNSTITITTTTTIPANTSITVTLFEDVSGDGTGASTDALGNSYDNSASVVLAGGTDETNDLTGFDGGGSTNDYWAHFEIDGNGTDPTLSSPTFTSFDAAASGATGPTASTTRSEVVGSATTFSAFVSLFLSALFGVVDAVAPTIVSFITKTLDEVSAVSETMTANSSKSFSPVYSVIEAREVGLTRGFSPTVAVSDDTTRGPSTVHSSVSGVLGSFERVYDGVRTFAPLVGVFDTREAGVIVPLAPVFGVVDTFSRVVDAIREFSPTVAVHETADAARGILQAVQEEVVGVQSTFERTFDGTRLFPALAGTVSDTSLGPGVLQTAVVGTIGALIDPLFTGVRVFSPVLGVADEPVTALAGELRLVVESLVATVDGFDRTFTGFREFSSLVGLAGTLDSAVRVVRSLAETVGLIGGFSLAVTHVSAATVGLVESVSETLESGLAQVLDATVGLAESPTTTGTFVRAFGSPIGVLHTRTLSEAVAHALAAVETIGGTTTLARGPTTTRAALAGTSTSLSRGTSRVLSPLLATATRLTFPSRLQHVLDVVAGTAPSTRPLKGIPARVGETGKLYATVAAGKLHAIPVLGKLFADIDD